MGPQTAIDSSNIPLWLFGNNEDFIDVPLACKDSLYVPSDLSGNVAEQNVALQGGRQKISLGGEEKKDKTLEKKSKARVWSAPDGSDKDGMMVLGTYNTYRAAGQPSDSKCCRGLFMMETCDLYGICSK